MRLTISKNYLLFLFFLMALWADGSHFCFHQNLVALYDLIVHKNGKDHVHKNGKDYVHKNGKDYF